MLDIIASIRLAARPCSGPRFAGGGSEVTFAGSIPSTASSSTSHRLVVEVDGAIHRDPEHAERDAARQRALEALGWRVLRLDAELVECDLAAALGRVRAALTADA